MASPGGESPLSDTFIRLVQVFRDDPEMRSYFGVLCQKPPLERNLLLTKIVLGLRQEGAESDLVTVAEQLRDPDLFERIQREIEKKE
ncbi:MAG: hypothetical protein J0L75_19980 [Spirochaetes bacterium]|nr:hypothetical protein [Spirochaetota bacterium]